MDEKRIRRSFDREFSEWSPSDKLDAVRLINEEGRTAAEVARDLGISVNVLYKWRRQLTQDPNNAFPGKGFLSEWSPSDKPDEVEFKRVLRENEILKQERDILKNLGHILNSTRMKYRFIQQHNSEFPLDRMCKVLKVSRSGYHSYIGVAPSRRQRENTALLKHIINAYNTGRGTYGSPRITAELRALPIRCSKSRVARLMKKHGIMAKTKRKFKVTTRWSKNRRACANLVKRNFSASAPNRHWRSDITYIWTPEGWMYLALILDVYSRMIVGWACRQTLSRELVTDAFRYALKQRKPQAGLVFHSDRGGQYSCTEFQSLLQLTGATQSMSSSGSYDNAICETVFHTIKCELVYLETFDSRDQARIKLFEYIEIFYNRKRRHSSLGYMSPLEFEKSKKVS
jgi:putative transposase